MPTEPARLSYRANGLTFHALSWGPVDGPLALCLHGYPDSAWTWRHLGPHLAERGWRVVAPFTRGYAPTDIPPDGYYQVGALASDAIAAHGALRGDHRAVLIGHDWGAIAGYSAAAVAPECFARLVTLAVPPLVATGERGASGLGGAGGLGAELALLARQARRSWYIAFQQVPGVSERSLARLIPRLWRDWSPGYDASSDIARVFESLDSPARRSAALSYYRAMAQPWRRSRSYAQIQRRWLEMPHCPLLYLHGDRDGCLLPELAIRAGASLTGDQRAQLVAGAGHFLHLEQPDTVNELISGFLADG